MKYVYYWAQNIYGDFFLLTTSELTISYTAPDDMDTQFEKYWGNCSTVKVIKSKKNNTHTHKKQLKQLPWQLPASPLYPGAQLHV